MSTENKGFDFDGCHKHRAEQSARIAGMYSNGEEIFQKAKKEGEALKVMTISMILIMRISMKRAKSKKPLSKHSE